MIALLQYYLAVNITDFLCAAGDKLSAKLSTEEFPLQRVSEASLLLLASAGAFPGASLAFKCFNHKTRKHSFRHAYVFATLLHFVLFTLFWWGGLIGYLL